MGKYLITGSGGRKFVVESSDPQTAYNDLNTHLASTGQPVLGVTPPGPNDPVPPKVDMDGNVSLESYANDAVNSLGSGLVKGGIQLAALPRTISDAAEAGSKWVAGKAGVDPSYVDTAFKYNPASYFPSEGQIQGAVENNITGKLYQPQTAVGNVAQTIGEFAPNALGGGGGLVRKAASVVVPALASEAAGALTQGTAAEPYARAAGALGGGLAAFMGSNAAATSKALSQAALDKDGLMAAKNDAYAAAQQTLGSQQVPVQDFADMVRGMNKIGAQAGLGGALDKTTSGLYTHSGNALSDVTDYLRQVAAGNAPSPTYGDLEQMRQVLGGIVQDSKDVRGNLSKDGYLAGKLQDVVDNTMGPANPYADARSAFQTMRKTQMIDQAIQTAQEAGQGGAGVELTLKNEFNKLIKSNVKNPVFSPEEIDAMRQVTGPVGPANLISILGKFGVSNDRIAAMLPAAGAGAAAHFAGIPGAIVETVLAGAAKKYATSARAQAAEDARNVVALGATGQQDIANQLSGDLSAIGNAKKLAAADAVSKAGDANSPMPPGAIYRDGLGRFWGYDANRQLVQIPAQ